jgi:hypothetical protein
MKRFVLWAVVPAFIASAFPAFAAKSTSVGTIEVMLYFKEGAVGTTLAAIDGNETTSDGRIGDKAREFCHLQGGYRVIESAHGEFKVRVHYSVYMDAPKKMLMIDRTLKVFSLAPPGNDTGAIPVSSDIMAGAHFIDPKDTIRD